MKTIHYQNKIGSHLVAIVPIAPFTPKTTSELISAFHFRYSIVNPRFIPCSILITIITTVFITHLTTTTLFIMTIFTVYSDC